MTQNLIITIGRQVGSGGRLVGRLLAERLGIKFYDREILSRAAKESGIKDEFFENADERNTLFHRFANFFLADHLTSTSSCLSSESLFQFQADAMRKAADEGGAVFVGRCSDYILRDVPHRTDVFITAHIDERIKRAVTYFNVTPEEAEKKIRQMEQARAEYYNFYTEKTWGAADGYHLCVDSTGLTIEQLADIIEAYVKLREQANNSL